MKPCMIHAKILFFALLICVSSGSSIQAGDDIEAAGNAFAYLLPATAAGLTLGYQDRQGTLQFAESTTLALGSTFALKYTVREERPNGHDHYSFPSGHSSVSFSSAEFLRMRYGWEYGLPAYAVATFVAYSRVEAKQHYLHDVIAGAAIGTGSSYLFSRPYKGWHIDADIDSKFTGIRLSRCW